MKYTAQAKARRFMVHAAGIGLIYCNCRVCGCVMLTIMICDVVMYDLCSSHVRSTELTISSTGNGQALLG